jgi:hypothetical protein
VAWESCEHDVDPDADCQRTSEDNSIYMCVDRILSASTNLESGDYGLMVSQSFFLSSLHHTTMANGKMASTHSKVSSFFCLGQGFEQGLQRSFAHPVTTLKL